MEELLLVNPRKRRSKSRKPRSAAQRAATKRMIAANRSRRSINPIKRRRARVAAVKSNPVRRRRARSVYSAARRSRRRNPISSATGITAMLKSALTGAAGAVTVNAAYNYLPIPATMKAGYTGYAVKGALALALGVFGRKFLGARAVKMAEGSLTITLSQVMVELGSKAGLSLGYYSPARTYSPGGMMRDPKQLSENVDMVGVSPVYPDSGYNLAEYVGMGEYVA